MSAVVPTEVVWNEFNGELNRFSFDIRAVRLTERFISGHPIEPSELKNRNYILSPS